MYKCEKCESKVKVIDVSEISIDLRLGDFSYFIVTYSISNIMLRNIIIKRVTIIYCINGIMVKKEIIICKLVFV